MRIKVLLSVLVLFSLMASCNLPIAQAPVPPADSQPVSSDVDVIGTAVELTAVARLTEIAGSATATSAASPTFTPAPTFTPTFTPTSTSIPTQCSPQVTATVVANVRAGPNTAYGIVGSLALGQTASIVGRNDAYTWWYIAYPGAAGGHAWVAGSVVTSACVPSVVQVVAAPPLPTAVPTEVVASSDDDDNDLLVVPHLNLPPMQLQFVDLALVGMQLSSDPATQGVAINVKITVENKGTVDVGSFNVLWWAAGPTVGCSWTVPSLAAGAKKALTCSYTYGGWNNAYQIKAMVDPEHAVAESNEGNNIVQRTLQVKDATP